jgi:hypothetical protein
LIKKEVISDTPVMSKSVFNEAELLIRAAKKGKKILAVPINFERQDHEGWINQKIILAFVSLIDLLRVWLNLHGLYKFSREHKHAVIFTEGVRLPITIQEQQSRIEMPQLPDPALVETLKRAKVQHHDPPNKIV